MRKSIFTVLSATLGASVLASPASASDPDDPIAAATASRLSVSLGVDLRSSYFFRGYLQEDRGLITQPWAELGVAVVDRADGSPGVSLAFGSWNSFHSEHTGATEDNARSWYEADMYGGIALDWDSFTLGAGYTIYTYPSSDFNTVHEVGLSVGYTPPDDSLAQKVLGDLSLSLSVEVENSNVSTDEAAYLELGFGPSFDLLEGKATLSIPVTLGFSVDEYYTDRDGNDDFFGYASVGADVSIPLGSGAYGAWTVNLGTNVLLLGTAAEQANSGDDVEILGYIGLSFAF